MREYRGVFYSRKSTNFKLLEFIDALQSDFKSKRRKIKPFFFLANTIVKPLLEPSINSHMHTHSLFLPNFFLYHYIYRVFFQEKLHVFTDTLFCEENIFFHEFRQHKTYRNTNMKRSFLFFRV